MGDYVGYEKKNNNEMGLTRLGSYGLDSSGSGQRH
jgi:hypothetical protein